MSKRIKPPKPNICRGWALSIVRDGQRELLGKFCWWGFYSSDSHMPIPVFRTKRHALEAVKSMTSYRLVAKPIRVTVTIEAKQ